MFPIHSESIGFFWGMSIFLASVQQKFSVFSPAEALLTSPQRDARGRVNDAPDGAEIKSFAAAELFIRERLLSCHFSCHIFYCLDFEIPACYCAGGNYRCRFRPWPRLPVFCE